MIAMAFTLTSASSPPTMPRQLASPPPRPSGRQSEGWKSSCVAHGPRISSSSWSGSKRRARSCRKVSISEGLRVVFAAALEASGPEKLERERRGATSSGGPSGFLYQKIRC